MQIRKHLVLAAVAFLGLLGSAEAAPGTGITWSFQSTNISLTGGQTAVAMRNGMAWPVIITDFQTASSSYGSAYSLFPSSLDGSSRGSWQGIGSGFYTSEPGRLRAASSPDGRVAFAAEAPSSPGAGMGGKVSSVSGGWGSLVSGTLAVSFSDSGSLFSAGLGSVAGVGAYPGMSSIIDMAVAPNGDVGVVESSSTGGVRYWHYSAWNGWTSATFASNTPSFWSPSIDVEFDSLNRPHIVGVTTAGQVLALDFSTVTGTWSSTILANSVGTSYCALAANSKGTVGTAYLSSNQVVYAYKDDNAEWASTVVAFSSRSQELLGIDYDYADLPVLSYSDYTGMLTLAYDPIVVPEPTGVALVSVLTGVSLLRRRRA